VTNNNGFWIGWLGLLILLLQLKLIIAVRNRWLSKTPSIPSWTTNVCSSTVTHLVLFYEFVTSSASVVSWLTLHSWTLNICILLRMNHWTPLRINESFWDWVWDLLRPTVSRPVYLGIWGLRPDICYCQTVAGFLKWDALSDERTGVPYAIAAGPRQRSHSQVKGPWDSRSYFTVSDSRITCVSPPTTRTATLEVFDSFYKIPENLI
jgi:hypothetical protein